MFRRTNKQQPRSLTAIKIAGIYALVSALWILLSDQFILFIASDHGHQAFLQTLKGWFFVAFTSLLLFFLIRRSLNSQHSYEEALGKSEQKYKTLIAYSPIAHYRLDLEGRVTNWNPAAEKIFGWTWNEVIGKPLPTVPGEYQIERQQMQELVKSGQGVIGQDVIRRKKDGSLINARVSIGPISGNQGEVAGFMVALDDITESKRTENELKKLSHAVEQSPAVVMITDLEGNIEYVNPKFTQISGYSPEEVLGQNPRILKSGKMPDDVYKSLWQTLTAGKEWQGELLNKHKDGSFYWERAMIAPLRNKQGEITHYIGVNEDITSQKNYEQQLEHQATHDDLTGLANRLLLKDRLEQAILYAQRSNRFVAVLLLDLDRFKRVNDSLGHSIGDKLLCEVGRQLSSLVRETDTVARFGGDEFVVMLSELAQLNDIQPIAEKILRAIAVPKTIEEREITLTASMGISTYPTDGNDITSLLSRADIAMYKAKNLSNQLTFYTDGMDNKILEALELEGSLRQAQERGEFKLYYQPKVDLKTARIFGCEALLRWQHPQRGMIPPGQFIPLAEETGLIVSIGTWVLKEACRQNLEWQAAGLPPLCVAVNLSARQFQQEDLVEQIREVLNASGLDPALLEIELTESMIVDDPLAATNILRQLKQLGVTLSLDDFGTGYSSLNYLRRFPVDALKIDQSFIQDVGEDPSGASVITSIIDIAHNLNLSAIAEGVETREHVDFLLANNCDSIQGYYFSKPLPADEFAQFVQKEMLDS